MRRGLCAGVGGVLWGAIRGDFLLGDRKLGQYLWIIVGMGL